MKIYFSGSIRGGRNDVQLYSLIIKHLQNYGNVLTKHVGDENLEESGEDGISDNFIYERDMEKLKEADILVAEVSIPSLGVGYEIAKAEQMKKDILCLYREKDGGKLSAMLNGNSNLMISKYKTLEDALRNIDLFFIPLHSSG